MTDLCVRMCEMFRKVIISVVALLLSLSALAQSERLYLDTDFNFDFDNTEYSGSNLGASETLFGVSLAPVLRYEWYLQSYRYRLRTQLLEGTLEGQGGVRAENRWQATIQSADYIVGGKSRAKIV